MDSRGSLRFSVNSAGPCIKGWAEPMWLVCRSMLGSHAIQGSPTGQQFGRFFEYITLMGLKPISNWADLISHLKGANSEVGQLKGLGLDPIHSESPRSK